MARDCWCACVSVKSRISSERREIWAVLPHVYCTCRMLYIYTATLAAGQGVFPRAFGYMNLDPELPSRAKFAERVALWSRHTHLYPTRVRVRRMTRYWAMCNADDSITFSAALLEQPAAFQDLVIVHELVHLLFRDHGPHFRKLLRAFLPDCDRAARLAPDSPEVWYKNRGVRDACAVYSVCTSSAALSS